MEPKIKSIDYHLYCAFLASSVAGDIIAILPEGDLINDLEMLISTQFELFVCLLEGKHYGTDRLREFQELCVEMKKQITRLEGES